MIKRDVLNSRGLSELKKRRRRAFLNKALFYPKSAIRRSLASTYPRLKDIELRVKSGGALLISVTEREPLYTWCGENIPETDTAENQICYFLDKEGYVFDEAPYFSGDVYFKFYGAFGVVPLYPKGSYFA